MARTGSAMGWAEEDEVQPDLNWRSWCNRTGTRKPFPTVFYLCLEADGNILPVRQSESTHHVSGTTAATGDTNGGTDSVCSGRG